MENYYFNKLFANVNIIKESFQSMFIPLNQSIIINSSANLILLPKKIEAYVLIKDKINLKLHH